MVTLGRLSKIMPNTPIGTRIWPTRMPLGCCFMPMISPITSGIAASCSQPWAQVSSTLGVSLSRSTIGSARPAARSRSRDLQGLQLARNRAASSQGGVLHCRGRLGCRSSLGLQADGLQGFGDRVGGHGLYCRRYCMSPQITHC
jgi:hypothetical protein